MKWLLSFFIIIIGNIIFFSFEANSSELYCIKKDLNSKQPHFKDFSTILDKSNCPIYFEKVSKNTYDQWKNKVINEYYNNPIYKSACLIEVASTPRQRFKIHLQNFGDQIKCMPYNLITFREHPRQFNKLQNIGDGEIIYIEELIKLMPDTEFKKTLERRLALAEKNKRIIAKDKKSPSNQKIAISSNEEVRSNKLLTYFEGPNSKTGTICLIKYQPSRYRFQDNIPNNDTSKCTLIIKKIDDEDLFMSLLKDYLNNKSSLLNNTLVSPLISHKIEINLANSKVRPLNEVLEEKYGDPKTEETKVTAKPKKKFQPKETISDDESPIIDIASVITVNDQAYTLKGKIKDKSGVYLTVDGRAVDLNKDEFEIERFSVNPDQQQKIKIVAIDEWNNKSEKTVTVKIDLSQNKVAKKYEDLKPNKIRRVKTDNNRIAIIIGIEKYQYLNNLDAKYANRDANAFRAYATRALGIPSSNVEVLVDDKATRTQILKTFKNNLRRLAGKKGKDIHIFFAGHGLASDNGEDLYILPQDGESSLLEDTAISRVELIELIQQVNPNSVTMYFDTCYSGQTRDEQLLVASLRPVRIVADEQETPDNFTIFTASDYDQTSGSIEEAKHGMFSYYLMKGLEGNADLNTDNKITNGELISYLKDNVSQEAFIQNRQQDPMFSGDPNKVLVSF